MTDLTANEILARVDPQLRAPLADMLPPNLPNAPLTAELVRELDARLQSVVDARVPPRLDTVTRADGSILELRVFDGADLNAAVLWIHGGGMFLGSARSDDQHAESLAELLGVTVVTVDYRLAPEFPHPAPLEDCYAALRWISAHFARVVVVGFSAGGGLAAGLCLLARDRSGPAIAGALLAYPMLDDRMVTESATRLADAPVCNRRLNELGWASYLAGRDADIYAAPARATDLRGFPPTRIEVGELDLFVDEDLAFARRLSECGVDVDFDLVPSAVHAFELLSPDADLSRTTLERRAAWLTQALDRGVTSTDGS